MRESIAGQAPAAGFSHGVVAVPAPRRVGVTGRRPGPSLDRVAITISLLAVAGSVLFIALPLPVPEAVTNVAGVVALAAMFAVSECIVARLGSGGFPVIVGVRAMSLLVALQVAAPAQVVAAHAFGSVVAMLAVNRAQVAIRAAVASTGVLGTALAAAPFEALVTSGGSSLMAWWAGSFTAAVIANGAGSTGLAIDWLARGRMLTAKLILAAVACGIVLAAAAASIGLTILIFTRTDPTELLLLAGPAAVTVLAYAAYAAQRRHQEQVEFLYHCGRTLDGASSGATMLRELLERTVAHFDADRAEILLDHIGDRPIGAAVGGDGFVERLRPIDPDVAAQRIDGLPSERPNTPARNVTAVDDDGTETRAVVRLGTLARPIGVLIVTRARRRPWARSERRLLETLAAHVGSTLGTTRVTEELTESVENLERLAALVTAADDAIIGVATDGTIVTWNGGAEALFGYPAAEVIGRHGDLLGGLPRRSDLADAFERAMRGEVVRDLHAEAHGRDGSIVPIAVSMAPIRAEDGSVRGISVVARDETPRALEDVILREDLARFQRVFQGSPVGLGVIGEDFTWVRANEALSRALDLTADELVGRRFERTIARDDIEQAHGLVSRLLRGESDGSTIEVRLQARHAGSDRRRIAAFTVRALRTPSGMVQALCTVEDVTERRLAEERDRATEARVLAAVLAMTPIRDQDGILRVLLQSVREILCAPSAAVVYQDPADPSRQRIVRDGGGPSMTDLDNAIEDHVGGGDEGLAGSSLLTVPLRMDGAVSGLLHVSAGAGREPFGDADRAVARGLAAQAALSLENARAHTRALTLVRELDDANVALQAASEAKSRFLANVSHELRTPLHGILLAAQLLRDADGATDRPRIRQLPAVIEGSGRYLVGLIDDLVDLSRFEISDVILRVTDVRLGALLDDVRLQIRPLAAERGVRLRIAGEGGLLVTADPLRLRQVILNLLANGVKYTDPGGLVELRARRAGADLVMDVRDTGIGINPADLERAFEPFERLGRDGVAGAGLGLAIARRIVELHGGTLTARSAPGIGSTFTVRLPAGVSSVAASPLPDGRRRPRAVAPANRVAAHDRPHPDVVVAAR